MIDRDFSIDTDHLHFTVVAEDVPRFLVRRNGREVSLVCPNSTRFAEPRVQVWFRKVVDEILRNRAKEIFPARLRMLAATYGFSYNRVCIKGTRTRWGSCSSLGNINLSYYLVLVPAHLSDYVMLHELCHTRQLNHGPLFWAELDACTEGRSKALRNELRAFVPKYV